MSKDGGPAFSRKSYRGMSLRDYFASTALQGMMGGGKDWRISMDGKKVEVHLFSQYATAAYRIADAMLAERDK